jgi:hypothetical protein
VPRQVGEPGPEASEHRACNKLSGYAAVPLDPDHIKAGIHAFGPILVVVDVFQGFDERDAQNVAHPVGPSRGMHSVALVGWDDEKQAYVLRNSWGTDWGQRGYCWLPYHYPLHEAWSVVPALTDEGHPPAPAPEPWWMAIAHFLHIVP